MERRIISFEIAKKGINLNQLRIYDKLGLNISIKDDIATISSTSDANIISVGPCVEIEICSFEKLAPLITSGFSSEEELHTMPLKVSDEFGNHIVININKACCDKRIAILTSGGDSPGMNSAIRAIIRTGIKWGAEVYGVMRGFDGLIAGNIKRMSWDSVDYHAGDGGTILFSARSDAFRTKEGRKIAVSNLARRGINALVVIGGDGSLEGAMTLKNEFSTHLSELISEGLQVPNYDLQLVALPGSIDNDISCTEMTLGADSALHRVVEAVDNLITTMMSHQRAFVLEVMGRNCGWLALMSAFATGAEYVFLPEAPVEDWQSPLISAIKKARDFGKTSIFVIISEGAVDIEGQKIQPKYVKSIIECETGIESRVLTLGHIQRGGEPSAFDRISGTLMGCAAVKHIFSKVNEAVMIALRRGNYEPVNLERVIETNKKINTERINKNFGAMMASRGSYFERIYKLNRWKPLKQGRKKKILVLHEGIRVGGMNVALNAIVRYGSALCDNIYVAENGFEGFIKGRFDSASSYEFINGIQSGASVIGSGASNNLDVTLICQRLAEHEFDSLIIIGGSENLYLIQRLSDRLTGLSLCIDVLLIPATIANNIPGIDTSIGSDTALNCITRACDSLKLTSLSMPRTVFVVDVEGGECGYLAAMGAIACGAFDCFIPERPCTMTHLSETVERLRHRFEGNTSRHGIVLLRNDQTFAGISGEAFSKLVQTDGRDRFNTNFCVLGYLQRGGNPSPIDRITATVLGMKTIDVLLGTDEEEIAYKNDAIRGVLGIMGEQVRFTSIAECMKQFDKTRNRMIKAGWLKYANICKSLE
ncbi:ATP-dependent 6-phosphofructokinase, liver type [Astathelohania contejeani]|uniref:6-phosphofructokinase n=1 Tax=Astathelohania contejeani TaxID=164912 RepID=A0ABQ7I161_9MICR|nr:ATP-dependent 6-phosphofructokinase, liver type [Thelohania contejeani]